MKQSERELNANRLSVMRRQQQRLKEKYGKKKEDAGIKVPTPRTTNVDK